MIDRGSLHLIRPIPPPSEGGRGTFGLRFSPASPPRSARRSGARFASQPASPAPTRARERPGTEREAREGRRARFRPLDPRVRVSERLACGDVYPVPLQNRPARATKWPWLSPPATASLARPDASSRRRNGISFRGPAGSPAAGLFGKGGLGTTRPHRRQRSGLRPASLRAPVKGGCDGARGFTSTTTGLPGRFAEGCSGASPGFASAGCFDRRSSARRLAFLLTRHRVSRPRGKP